MRLESAVLVVNKWAITSVIVQPLPLLIAKRFSDNIGTLALTVLLLVLVVPQVAPTHRLPVPDQSHGLIPPNLRPVDLLPLLQLLLLSLTPNRQLLPPTPASPS